MGHASAKATVSGIILLIVVGIVHKIVVLDVMVMLLLLRLRLPTPVLPR